MRHPTTHITRAELQKSDDPNQMYKQVLTRYDIGTDDLEFILKDFVKKFQVQVQMQDTNRAQYDMIEDAKRQMVHKLAEELINSNNFDIKFTTAQSLHDPFSKTVTCEMEILDTNKYNRVFRPERCI